MGARDAAAGDTAAHPPRRGGLFRCPQTWLRESDSLSRARNLALAPLQDHLIHPRPLYRPPHGFYASNSSGIELIMASVVSMREAMDAAFCRAVRVTLVGSITPAFTRSSYCSVAALNP